MNAVPAAGWGLAAILVMMAAVWVGSLRWKDTSLVDRFWGMGFVLLSWVYVQFGGGWAGAGWAARVLVILVTAWGLRLSLYITWRNWGHGEDYRYQAMRSRRPGSFWWISLATVFGLQGVLAWVIATPLLVALTRSPSQAGGPWLVLGMISWAVGFLFEALGDAQLALFRADPANRGRVMDRGLWRFTRHPNYFGDAVLWWGYYGFAVAAGGWWTAFAPALMTLMLMKVSGVALLEKTLQETKPQYREYVRRTSAFVPRRPRAE